MPPTPPAKAAAERAPATRTSCVKGGVEALSWVVKTTRSPQQRRRSRTSLTPRIWLVTSPSPGPGGGGGSPATGAERERALWPTPTAVQQQLIFCRNWSGYDLSYYSGILRRNLHLRATSTLHLTGGLHLLSTPTNYSHISTNEEQLYLLGAATPTRDMQLHLRGESMYSYELQYSYASEVQLHLFETTSPAPTSLMYW
jgi:hypothetical protein